MRLDRRDEFTRTSTVVSDSFSGTLKQPKTLAMILSHQIIKKRYRAFTLSQHDCHSG